MREVPASSRILSTACSLVLESSTDGDPPVPANSTINGSEAPLDAGQEQALL